MTEHTPKTLGNLSRNRKIALVLAVLLLVLGALGLANVSRISSFIESSGAFSSIEEPTGNKPPTSTSSTSTLDPSTPVSSDGSVGDTPPSAPNSPGETPPSSGSEPGSTGTGNDSGSGSTGSSPLKPSSSGKEQPPVDPVVKPSTNGGTSPAPAAPQESAPKPTKISVHIRVDASAAVDKGFSGSSTMLSKNVSVAPGTSALDASKASGISFKTRGTALGTYVAAIGSLAEKDYGSASGWTYSINGSKPSKSSSKYIVEDGDSVTWIYVIN